jgi:hypothetical protein
MHTPPQVSRTQPISKSLVVVLAIYPSPLSPTMKSPRRVPSKRKRKDVNKFSSTSGLYPLPECSAKLKCWRSSQRRRAIQRFRPQRRPHHPALRLLRPVTARQLGVVEATRIAERSCAVRPAAPLGRLGAVTAMATTWWCSALYLCQFVYQKSKSRG